MRKYYQAALALIAAVSLISLLFYRHEYNKLRYVLEVFNYFGKPSYQKDTDINCTNAMPLYTKLNMQFEEPYSSWQRLDNDLYLYSAYSIKETEVQVIGFGSLNSIKDMQCVMFFESENKPILGSFKYIFINNDTNILIGNNIHYYGYRFLCEHNRNEVPIGISFLTRSNANLNDAPILPVKNQLIVHSNYSSIGVCVTPPSMKYMHPLEMINFINFHDLIGMNNFIIYDYAIPSKLNSYLKEMSMIQTPYWKFTYAIVSWNFPFPGIDRKTIKDIIQTDCLYRTYNKATHVITLSWNEYMVLKYHHSVEDLMNDYQRSKLKADGYKLQSLTFCTQQAKDTPISNFTPMIFKITHFEPSTTGTDSSYMYIPHDTLKKTNSYIREIGKDLVAVNRYKHCDKNLNPKTDLYDTSILRFADDIQNSAFFKKAMTEKMFLPGRQ